MTSDTQGERWSLREIFLFGVALIVIAFISLLSYYTHKNQQRHVQAFQRIAAMKVIQARYRPAPEFLEMTPNHPCLWAVIDSHAPDKTNPYGTWQVRCEIRSESGSGTRTVAAQWIVDSFLADTPDAGAQKLFIRNPQ